VKQALDAANGDLLALTSQYEDLKKSRQDAIQEVLSVCESLDAESAGSEAPGK